VDYSPFFETAVQTFVLDELPADTPPHAEFFLSTNLEGWEPSRPELRFLPGEGGLTLRRAYPVGTLLGYKVTRGSAPSEEGDAWGERRLEVAAEGTQRLDVRSWQDLSQGGRPGSLGGNTERLSVHSPELGATFRVTVWLPPQYGETGERFSTLYLHDGQNVMDRATAFAGVSWEAGEAAARLAGEGLPCLLVAVEVRAGQRANDYVPFPIPANGHASSAAEYQRFLADTLRPLIDARFQTLPDARHTAQAGSSFGGVASLSGGLERPGVWGTLGAFSPSLWVGDGGLFGWSGRHPAPDTRLYLDMGTREGSSLAEAAWLVQQTRLYAARMRGQVGEVQLEIGEGQAHDEAAWAARFPGFLRWWLEGLDPPGI